MAPASEGSADEPHAAPRAYWRAGERDQPSDDNPNPVMRIDVGPTSPEVWGWCWIDEIGT
jgi:hypothetical protein